jgi:hypothetical protein
MGSRFCAASFAFVLAAVPLAALSQTTTQTVAIVRSSGTCPKSIAITVKTKQYAGGVMLDYTAQTMVPAYTAELVSATPQRIVFDAQLHEAFASCEAAGRSGAFSFTLHKGKLTYVLTNAKGPDAVYPGLLDVSVDDGLPHVKMAIPD